MQPLALALCGHTVPSLVPRRGDFADWFRAGLGLDSERAPAFDLAAGERLPDPAELRGVVFSGSPAMVTDEEPWSVAAEAWIRAALAVQLPILGVCYGHQLLARSGGGRAGFSPRGRAIGSARFTLEPAAADCPLFDGHPSVSAVQVSHSQAVLELPPAAVLLGHAPHDPHHAFALGSAVGVQFHPEFDADITRGYIADRRAALELEGLHPEALLAGVVETPDAWCVLERFERSTR